MDLTVSPLDPHYDHMARVAETLPASLNRRWSLGDSETATTDEVAIVGTYRAPRRFRQTFKGRGGHPDVTIEIEVDDAESWRTVRVELDAGDVQGVTISGVPLTDLETVALANNVWMRGVFTGPPANPPGGTLAAFTAMHRGRRFKRGGVALADVATIYQTAVDSGSRHPSRDVANALGIAESTARKYVSQARRTDPPLLPPTTRGKAKA